MFNLFDVLPADPILGLMKRFADDPNPNKVDLGIGIYKDDKGATPILSAVAKAQQKLIEQQVSMSYVAPPGNAVFLHEMATLVFADTRQKLSDRLAIIQTPGGCGALRVIAEVIRKASQETTVWVSNPTWGNHMPLLGDADLPLKQYHYLSADRRTLDWPAMQASISQVKRGDVVLIHACCHNPTGVDLSLEHWEWLTEAAINQGFVPFIDMAYQGFGEGLDEDSQGLRYMAERLPELMLAVSCSKNFGVYRERTGIACFLGETPSSAKAIQTHLLSTARGIYSMPPDHGAALVAAVLSDDELRAEWQVEVQTMRKRISGLRAALSDAMAEKGHDEFQFVTEQKGMFSYLGISAEQVAWLAKNRSIYLLSSSRASISGLSQANLDYVSSAFVDALNYA